MATPSLVVKGRVAARDYRLEGFRRTKRLEVMFAAFIRFALMTGDWLPDILNWCGQARSIIPGWRGKEGSSQAPVPVVRPSRTLAQRRDRSMCLTPHPQRPDAVSRSGTELRIGSRVRR